ncbi:MAG TPA: lysylphosphatidylglycerol synthase transmembrane domain-containing protein, partial [Chloroflexota bacterium]
RNRWARYGLSAALITLVLIKVQPQHVARAVGTARPDYLLLALVLTLPFLYLKTARWYLLLRSARIESTFPEAAASLLGGMGLALLTPARLGELARVAYLRDSQKWKAGGLVMIDKGLDVLVLAILSVAGAWTLLGKPAGCGMAVVALAGLTVVYNPRRVHLTLEKMSAPFPLRSRLSQVWTSLESLSTGSTSLFLLLTLLSFVCVLAQFGLILLSWRSWSPDVVFLTFPLVILTNVLPITIGGLGVREGAAALLLAHYGVSAADAALAAFLMFAMNTALPGLVGAMLLPASGPPSAQPVGSLDHT